MAINNKTLRNRPHENRLEKKLYLAQKHIYLYIKKKNKYLYTINIQLLYYYHVTKILFLIIYNVYTVYSSIGII